MEPRPLTCVESYITDSEPGTSNSSSRQPMVSHVYGVLVARSHILKSQPPFFLISLSGHKYPILIKVGTIQAESWISSLNMHSTYKFSHLLRSCKTYYDPHETISYFNTTECSLYIELDAIPPCINPWVQINGKLINYQGIVTSTISPLGLVLLDDKLNLCVFFVWAYINVSGLLRGQEIKICNAHLTTSNMLVMCCRSSFHILKDPLQSEVNPSLSRIVGDLTFGYGDYRWLQKQLRMLEQKFCDDFLSEILNSSTYSKSCQEIRINTLAAFLGLSSPYTRPTKNLLNSDELIRDFFSVEHKCILYKQPESNRPVISLLKEQFTSLHTFLEHTDSSPFAQQLPYWRWCTHNVITGNDLLGYLSVSEVDSLWHLSDASCTYTCLIDKHLNTDLQGQIVYIRRYKVVLEKFVAPNACSCDETSSKVYLFIPHDNIIPLTKTCFSSPLECNVPAIQQVVVCCTLCSNARRHIQDELTFSGCSEEWRKSDVINLEAARVYSHTKHIHAVVIHYVATPTKLRGVVYCFILVSVLQSSSHHAEAGAFPCILVLEGRLLQAIPLLELGVAFYLHLPIEQDVTTFTHAKLNIQLPWSVVQLPEETAFSRHMCIHSGSWWTLRDLASKDMCCIEGIVESRKHLPPKFDSEFASINTPGYGEPNLRTIMVVIRDEEKSHTLYLNHWNKRCYPLGLVPGARICATLVKQTTSSSSNEYFQATDLTAINILDISDSVKQISRGDAWSCACDITLANDKELENIVCGSVDSWIILSVVITAVCGGCKLLRLNGPCEFPGCLAGDDSVTFIANARISINGMGGKKIVHLKDDNVREMMNFTQRDWDVLLSLSMKHELKFKKHHDFVQRQFRSDAENIFQLYCLDPALTNRCIYIRCKGFKKPGDMDVKNTSNPMKFQSIFCLELVNKCPWSETPCKIK